MHSHDEKLYIQRSIHRDFYCMQLFVVDFATLLEKITEKSLATGCVLRSVLQTSGTYYIDGDWYLDYNFRTNRICFKAGIRYHCVKLSERMFGSVLYSCVCALNGVRSY